VFGRFTGSAGPLGDFARAVTERATGGPLSAFQPSIVGERGPELFIPSASGNVIPNGGGGAVTINNYNDFSNASPEMIGQILQSQERIAQRNKAEIADLIRRGRFATR